MGTLPEAPLDERYYDSAGIAIDWDLSGVEGPPQVIVYVPLAGGARLFSASPSSAERDPLRSYGIGRPAGLELRLPCAG